MRRFFIVIFAACLSMPALAAQVTPLSPPLMDLSFLVGSWHSGTGRVAETGGMSKGTSLMTPEAGGAVLLRRDHVELFDKMGKHAGSFDILMTIYSERGAIRADYFDGSHVIHYSSASIVPNKSVVFSTGAAPGVPMFRLSYRLAGNIMAISFAMAPPGRSSFREIADGTLRRGQPIR